MMNRKECFAKVDAEFSARRKRAEDTWRKRCNTLYGRIPRLAEIEEELHRNASSLFSAVYDLEPSEKLFEMYQDKALSLQKERAEILVKNGYSADYLEIPYLCAKCKDEGYIGSKMCACFKKELHLEMMRAANLDMSYANKTFDDFSLSHFDKTKDMSGAPSQYLRMKAVVAFCKNFVDTFKEKKQNLYLWGNPGCGKTFLSALMGFALTEKGYFVYYTSTQDMVDAFEAEKFGKGGSVGTDVFESADLLIIDDLGAEYHTPFAESVIYNVINNRINSSKPFIVSSNLSSAELGDFYHDRILSRVVHASVNLHCEGKDMRVNVKKGK